MENTTISKPVLQLNMPDLSEFDEKFLKHAKGNTPPHVMQVTVPAQAEWFEDHEVLYAYPTKLLSWIEHHLMRLLRDNDMPRDLINRFSIRLSSTYTTKNSRSDMHTVYSVVADWSRKDGAKNTVVVMSNKRRIEITKNTLRVWSADRTVDLAKWLKSPTGEGTIAWQMESTREWVDNSKFVCPVTRYDASMRLHRILYEFEGIDHFEAYARYWSCTRLIQENREKPSTGEQALMIKEAHAFIKLHMSLSSQFAYVAYMRLIDRFIQMESSSGIRYITTPLIKRIGGVDHVLTLQPMTEEEYNDPTQWPGEVGRISGTMWDESETGKRVAVPDPKSYRIRRYVPLEE